jgi:hypothetical protein
MLILTQDETRLIDTTGNDFSVYVGTGLGAGFEDGVTGAIIRHGDKEIAFCHRHQDWIELLDAMNEHGGNVFNIKRALDYIEERALEKILFKGIQERYEENWEYVELSEYWEYVKENQGSDYSNTVVENIFTGTGTNKGISVFFHKFKEQKTKYRDFLVIDDTAREKTMCIENVGIKS